MSQLTPPDLLTILQKNADHPVMKLTRFCAFTILITASAFASDSERRIDHAASAFQELMRTPDKGTHVICSNVPSASLLSAG